MSIVLSLLGVNRILDEQGVGLNLQHLLIFAAVFGFGGAFIPSSVGDVAGMATAMSSLTKMKTEPGT